SYKITFTCANTPAKLHLLPIYAQAFDPSKIKLVDIPHASQINVPVQFKVDASAAGSGDLQIYVSCDGKTIANNVNLISNMCFNVSFIPEKVGTFHVSIKLNGILVEGSPIPVNIVNSSFGIEDYQFARVGKEHTFNIYTFVDVGQPMRVFLKDPEGVDLPVKISMNLSKSLSQVTFKPEKIGKHRIQILYAEMEGKDIKDVYFCECFDPDAISIMYEQTFNRFEIYSFIVDTTNAGKGDIWIIVTQNQKSLRHELYKITEFKLKVSVSPVSKDPLYVMVLMNGHQSGKAFSVNCVDHIISSNALVNKPVKLKVLIREYDQKSITISVMEKETGNVIESEVKYLDNQRYEIKFVPTIVSIYEIRMYCNSVEIKGSPIKYDVFDASQIKIRNLPKAFIDHPCTFTVETFGAGEGNLEVTITDNGETLQAEFKEEQKRNFIISFVPRSLRIHVIDILFNKVPIPGTPFKIPIFSNDYNSIQIKSNLEIINGCDVNGYFVDEKSWIMLNQYTELLTDMKINILGPSGVVVHHIRSQDYLGRWKIEFTPREQGAYTFLRSNGIELCKIEAKYRSNEIIRGPSAVAIGSQVKYEKLTDQWSYISIFDSNNRLVKNYVTDDEDIKTSTQHTFNNEGTYLIIVTMMNGNISQYKITVYREARIILKNAGIGDISRVNIDFNEVSSSALNVVVKDSKSHTIPCSFYVDNNNRLVAEYVPLIIGPHEIYIRLDNKLMEPCPIVLDAFQCDDKPEPLIITQLNENVHYIIYKEDGEHNFKIRVIDPNQLPVENVTISSNINELTLEFIPIIRGIFYINGSSSCRQFKIPVFCFDDDYISLSPIPQADNYNSNTMITTSAQSSSKSLNDSENKSYSSEFKNKTSDNKYSSSSSLRSNYMAVFPSKYLATKLTKTPEDSTNGNFLTSVQSENVVIVEVSGLNDPQVNKPSTFIVKLHSDELSVKVIGPRGDTIPSQRTMIDDGIQICYTAKQRGPHEVHLDKSGEKILGSPIIVHAFNVDNIKVKSKDEYFVSQMCSVQIDVSTCGRGNLKAVLKDSHGNSINLTMQKLTAGLIDLQFMPISPCPHQLSLYFNRVPVANSPFELVVKEIRSNQIKLAHNELSSSLINTSTYQLTTCEEIYTIDYSSNGINKAFLINSGKITIGQIVQIACPLNLVLNCSLLGISILLNDEGLNDDAKIIFINPTKAGVYELFALDEKGQIIKDSKLYIPVFDKDDSLITGLSDPIPYSDKTMFYVWSKLNEDISVTVFDSSKTCMKVEVTRKAACIYECIFMTSKSLEYEILIAIGDTSLKGIFY
ncbi:hypothetical protein GJ496_002859, partial [Pomphorhynchus laevis]